MNLSHGKDLPQRFLEEKFLLGVNYWPRRSGVRMWRRFDAEEIDDEGTVEGQDSGTDEGRP